MGCDDYDSCRPIAQLTEVNISKIQSALPMTLLANHSERNVIRLELKHNEVLKGLDEIDRERLEPSMSVFDGGKGDFLLYQGVREMEQYFIIDGILKRVVSNSQGREMILRFAAESDIDTSYAAWRLKTPLPYSIRAVTKVRAAKLSMQQWVRFIEHHAAVKSVFEHEIMKLMSEVMAHTITLHLLDAPGRVQRFMRKHTDLADRLPKKDLASYLNLSPETLSRLKRRGKI